MLPIIKGHRIQRHEKYNLDKQCSSHLTGHWSTLCTAFFDLARGTCLLQTSPKKSTEYSPAIVETVCHGNGTHQNNLSVHCYLNTWSACEQPECDTTSG